MILGGFNEEREKKREKVGVKITRSDTVCFL